jgi:hypothetical protein
MRARKVTDEQLLRTFQYLCDVMGVVSRGFDREAITAPIDGSAYDGTSQWAMHHEIKLGWMVVCGAGGCGAALSRWNGFIMNRWDFLMMMEAVIHAIREHGVIDEQQNRR